MVEHVSLSLSLKLNVVFYEAIFANVQVLKLHGVPWRLVMIIIICLIMLLFFFLKDKFLQWLLVIDSSYQLHI